MSAPVNAPIPSAEARHWANINEATFAAGMRLLFWICRIFGRWPFRVVLYPVVLWYVLTQPRARRASAGYLERVSACDPASKVKPGFMAVLRHFAAFAESILDKMLLWGGLFNVDNTVLHGQERILDCMAQGRGGLMICAHLGNLELCRVLSKQQPGLKLTVLVHTKHARVFNQLLAQLDPDSELNLMQVTEMSPATAMLLNERIERGEFVVIAGDRIPVSPNPRVATAPFLGHDAPFPVGPYILASILQCPVYMLFALRTAQSSELHFELLSESVKLPRKEREQVLAGLTAQYAARLQYFCLRAPMQWFNFYDFWQLPMEPSHASR
jgi:predicted LPLAT superfamily acyltransferase